jgi:hypothetical protein
MLEFVEETHTYLLDGKPIPSVTQLLKPLQDFSNIPPHTLAKACEFGTNVHKMIELYLLDELDMDTLDPALLPPLEAFKRWQDNEGAALFLQGWPRIEQPLAHPRLHYAGTPDLDFLYGPIVDLKTRPFNPLTDPIQLAGYGELSRVNGGQDGDKWVLQLAPDGTYRFTNAHHKQAKSRFRFLLEFYQDGQNILSWRNDK